MPRGRRWRFTDPFIQKLKAAVNWKIRCGPGLQCSDSPSATTVSLAYVPPRPVMGISGGGGGAVMVQVENDGGSPGSQTAQCTFTYSIWAMDADIATDDPLAIQRVPHVRRNGTPAIAGRKVAAASGTFGLAFLDSGDPPQWRLLIAFNERDDTGICA